MVITPCPSLSNDTTNMAGPSRAWLESLPEALRNPVAQWAHRAARAGATTPLGVLLGLALILGEGRGDAWSNPEEYARLDPVAQALIAESKLALSYAEYVLWWEALPESDRRRLKSERSHVYQQQVMANQSPTDKQISFLRSLGYSGAPPSSKATASQLIDELMAVGRI